MPDPAVGAEETVGSRTNCPLKRAELFPWNLPFLTQLPSLSEKMSQPFKCLKQNGSEVGAHSWPVSIWYLTFLQSTGEANWFYFQMQ